ncbi:DUF3857 domain-containing protein [Saccharicrinis aurantiacus]|uniref:DUF3857 domain-containing protein n=1 Tax=Saccharicrinis aurantiacus TaxID=1849719 RepID=UPI0024900AD3|nr:DUF3857 domain-containing protein [Saccharicrinis aurantiacus]
MLSKLTISIALCFISMVHIYADERAEEIKQLMWHSDNPAFSVTETPEKWNNESAVIIAKHHRFEYKKPAIIAELQSNDFFHQRIKLNDKNAINAYAELTFPSENRGYYVYVGFKVIKKDGTEIIIDSKEAVEMEAQSRKDKKAYKKIAIPNLEEGDILDYYICEELTIPLGAYKLFNFTPVQYYLPQEYPVMEQRIEFNVQRRCFIALNSTNGAPEFELKVNEKKKENYYYLVDKDREKVDEHRWLYPYRQLPTIKFKVTYASNSATKLDQFVFLGKPGIAENSITESELITYMKDRMSIKHKVSGAKKYTKTKLGKTASDIDKATWAYYYNRNEGHQWDEVREISNYSLGGSPISDELYYLRKMHYYLASQKIPHELVVGVDRNVADLDEILMTNEMRFFLRIKEGDEYFYIMPQMRGDFPGILPYELVNTNAYIINPKKWTIKKEILRSSQKYPDTENTSSTLVIDADFKKCVVSNTSSISGTQKSYYQGGLLDYYDFIKEDEEHFEIIKDFKGTSFSKKKLNSLKESYLNNKDKRIAENISYLVENNYKFKVDTVTNFSYTQTGAYKEKPEFKFSYIIETEDLVHKAGRNYLLDVGKLIQGQVKIEKEELEREQDIYIYSPRIFNYTIKFDLPDGYTVQGLDKLNINVESDQGGFVSTASIESGQIVINTSKFYNQYFSKAETWDNYIDFLNAAYKFTEQKLLIKKL